MVHIPSSQSPKRGSRKLVQPKLTLTDVREMLAKHVQTNMVWEGEDMDALEQTVAESDPTSPYHRVLQNLCELLRQDFSQAPGKPAPFFLHFREAAALTMEQGDNFGAADARHTSLDTDGFNRALNKLKHMKPDHFAEKSLAEKLAEQRAQTQDVYYSASKFEKPVPQKKAETNQAAGAGGKQPDSEAVAEARRWIEQLCAHANRPGRKSFLMESSAITNRLVKDHEATLPKKLKTFLETLREDLADACARASVGRVPAFRSVVRDALVKHLKKNGPRGQLGRAKNLPLDDDFGAAAFSIVQGEPRADLSGNSAKGASAQMDLRPKARDNEASLEQIRRAMVNFPMQEDVADGHIRDQVRAISDELLAEDPPLAQGYRQYLKQLDEAIFEVGAKGTLKHHMAWTAGYDAGYPGFLDREGLLQIIASSCDAPEGSSASANRDGPSIADTLRAQEEILPPEDSGALATEVREAIDDVFADVVGMASLREALEEYGLTRAIVSQLEADGNALLDAGHLRAAEKIQDLIDERKEAMPPHMVLTGPSGSGKSFASRKLGDMLKALGILEEGHVVEAGRDKLVAAYQGHTEEKVREVFEEAKGGVLFIDEAYSLGTSPNDSGGGVEFGQIALQTILRLMQDPEFNDVVVVMAGYPAQMENMLDTNPGLRSRIGIQVELKDYTRTELGEIFKMRAEAMGLIIDDEAVQAFEEAIAPGFDESGQPKYNDLGNGRIAVKVAEQVLATKAREGARGVAALIVEPEHIALPPVLRRTLVSSVKDNHEEVIDGIERGLVGLHEVKERLRGLQQLGLRREALQLAIDELEPGDKKRDNFLLQLEHIDSKLMHHALFVGEAGTAKTTVARKLAEVLHSVGLLPQDKVVEAHARDLKTDGDIAKLLSQARGAVLFIDELYSLPSYLVATLTKAEELRGRTVLVGAGYPPEMEAFLAQNSGLESRFTQWNFENSTLDQCMAIFDLHASFAGMTVSAKAKTKLRELLAPHFDPKTGMPKSRSLGNGRLMRTILDRALAVFVPEADPSVIQPAQISLPPKVAISNEEAAARVQQDREYAGFKTKWMREAEGKEAQPK